MSSWTLKLIVEEHLINQDNSLQHILWTVDTVRPVKTLDIDIVRVLSEWDQL